MSRTDDGQVGPWSHEEKAWLLECLANGDTWAECAAWAGRTVADVGEVAMGLARPLTASERQAVALWCVDVDVPTIAERIGSTADSVRTKLTSARRKGYPVPFRTVVAAGAGVAVRKAPTSWRSVVRDPEHPLRDMLICLLIAEGLTYRQTAELVGVTRNVVSGTVTRCGGATPTPRVRRDAELMRVAA